MALHKSMKLAFVWIGIAFVALIAATVVTIRYASEGYTGPIEKGYYEKGLNYEKSILEQRKMIAEGYSYESKLFTATPELKKGKNQISIQFKKSGTPISGAKLQILIERSATDEWNRSLSLSEDSKNHGTYVGTVEIPEEGLWILSLQGEIEGRVLQKTAEIRIQ
ncbi:FixH family protein [Leptospira stimsonii]|uniref:Nitrogen fixation protein FixH n=1 Tax=Leptospira stimsonii TaxID=2202203 RepID=A0A4R9L0J9_9LEPT|nr:FixH family protein [Leptospira stimsonii]RHX84937.1 nitrogen fixation protein FixH [Leptospira stimsonii]TGK25269.1 nitrogen fixation protein FixH [Leptospira stimsonii]TGM08688.1 nitrogen fixation protein FixH [Leptospira stimsonii]